MSKEIASWIARLSKDEMEYALQSCIEFLIDTEDIRISSGDFPFPYWVSCGEKIEVKDI